MAITEKTTKQSHHACGFCTTGGRHDLCPGGVLNGNGVEVLVCACGCSTPKIRCFLCGAREDVNLHTWTCSDAEACDARAAARLSAALRDLRVDGTPESPRKPREAKGDRTTAPRAPKTGSCLCCGETTKGGLFLPGHDSRYLSAAVNDIREGTHDLADVQAAWRDSGISEALQAKLQKRVAA